MTKVRVYELAKEFGVESQAVMGRLQEMGEFARSASSTIDAPVVRRLKEAFLGQAPRQSWGGQAPLQAPKVPLVQGHDTRAPQLVLAQGERLFQRRRPLAGE